MLNPTRFLQISRPLASALLGASIVLVAAACSSAVGPFVWVTDYVAQTPATAEGSFIIGVGDNISVLVFDNDKMSASARVRSDGKIALPLISEVAVAGKTPLQVAGDVEKILRDQNLVISPRVSVSVLDVPKLRVTVLGAVARAGNLELEPGSGLAVALAGAGGLTDYAHKDRIFVVRKLPAPVRIRFTFSSLTDTGTAGAFKLQSGDILVVE